MSGLLAPVVRFLRTPGATETTCIRGNLYSVAFFRSAWVPRVLVSQATRCNCPGDASPPRFSPCCHGRNPKLYEEHYGTEIRVGCIASPVKRGATVAGQSMLHRCHALVLQLARHISTCYTSTRGPFVKRLRNPVAKLIIQMPRYRPLFHSSERGPSRLNSVIASNAVLFAGIDRCHPIRSSKSQRPIRSDKIIRKKDDCDFVDNEQRRDTVVTAWSKGIRGEGAGS